MHAPEHICREIERVHKWARLGWHGSKGFALLDLYPAPLAARTVELRWDDAGPVFGRSYDRLLRVPIVKQWFSPADVFSGRVVPVVRRLCTPLVERVRRRNEQAIRDRRSARKDLAGKIGSEMHWKARKDPHRGHVVANKHISKAEHARANGDWEADVPDETPQLPSALGMT